MSDGRAFTDYKPRCAVHSTLLSHGNGQSEMPFNSYELRQYMINNAENIIEKNREYVQNLNACGPCVQPWNQGTMLPEESIVKCNSSTCKVTPGDPNGLGRGRDYGIQPDMEFINKMEKRDSEWRVSSQMNKCTSSKDDLKYYPIHNVQEERLSVPSGGSPFM